MLCSLAPILKAAQKECTAVASINVYSAETIRGALKAAAACGRPVILAFAVRYCSIMSYEQFVWEANYVARSLNTDYALHLDHCGDLAEIRRALEAGFTSIMYDGSALPVGQNTENSKTAADLAHSFGSSAETELGAVRTGLSSDEKSGDRELYTDPGEAKRFAAATGTDALAVSVGTVHGMYKAKPHIRVDLVREIRQRTDVPLVLHGGSGTPDETLIELVQSGICKINFNTDISNACTAKIAALLQADPYTHLSRLSAAAAETVEEKATELIRLCACRV